VGEGDLVAQHVHFAGTPTPGVPRASADTEERLVLRAGAQPFRRWTGREHWFQLDALSLLQQLGLMVVPGPRFLPRILTHRLKKLRNKV
jgi:hypothetical protein